MPRNQTENVIDTLEVHNSMTRHSSAYNLAGVSLSAHISAIPYQNLASTALAKTELAVKTS